MPKAIPNLITTLIEAWNTADIERISAFYAPDYEGVDIHDAVPQRGPEGVLRMVNRYRQAFPDLRFTPEELIVQDDSAALVWMAQGTHQGKLMNIPATGRRVAIRGVSVLKIENGKVKHGLYIWDMAGLLRAIGLLPEL